ncbi:small ribosomal subunit Rsm22 family protein [Chelativorans sp.]|uniref:small ribosomal subunit Rsm22 family protein n=1 Tax=Chelativorans sp. TaxID=2203393 RepID=UPI002810C87D|nr:small ribosomal subunit Rsm22 family protein [Chelativorans sp.]
MELPARLRQAVDQMLEGIPLPELQRAAELLSRRYRSETRDGRLHVADALAASAYLAARLPATYAAVRKAMGDVAELQSGEPRTLLDVGAGPGTALWAALEEWPQIETAVLVEASNAMRQTGERLARDIGPVRLSWRGMAVEDGLPGIEPADLVTLCYVLDELEPAAAEALVGRLWTLAARTLLIVEPGTPAGWRRILKARQQLIEAGACVVAPCAHHHACPVAAPDWCHFSRRVARSRLHRLAKGGEVPWEDEKFIYLAASRIPAGARASRVLAPPKAASGMVRLKLCRTDGSVEERLVTRREGAAFKAAKRLEWGDLLEE